MGESAESHIDLESKIIFQEEWDPVLRNTRSELVDDLHREYSQPSTALQFSDGEKSGDWLMNSGGKAMSTSNEVCQSV